MTQNGQDDTVDAMVAKLEASRQRGARWIAAHVAADGTPEGGDDLNLYYRVPWALQVGGQADVAARALGWIERNALTPEGDLREGAAQKSWNWPAEWTKGAASYPLAIIAYGAWLLERYDTANAIMDALVAYQDPESGGGYIERPEPQHRTTGRQDMLCTAQIGLTALLTGRRDAADAAFRWYRSMWEQQPDLPGKLYLSTIGDRLVTDLPEGSAFGYVHDIAAPRQAFFNPGIGAAFLGRYAMATGNKDGLEIARALIRISEDAHELKYDHADTVHIGKFAWGIGVMLDVEPTPDLVADGLRMGQWFLDSQYDDGRWEPTKFLVPEPGARDALWKTAEHVVLMNILEMGLSGARSGIFGA